MRIQLTILFLFFTVSALASSDKEMKELFFKYDAIMDHQKFDLIDEVFTEKFLKDVGGKEEFIANIKELPKAQTKSVKAEKLSWRKGTQDEIFFAKKEEVSSHKSKKPVTGSHSGSSFIIVKDGGKLKINGTLSDDH